MMMRRILMIGVEGDGGGGVARRVVRGEVDKGRLGREVGRDKSWTQGDHQDHLRAEEDRCYKLVLRDRDKDKDRCRDRRVHRVGMRRRMSC